MDWQRPETFLPRLHVFLRCTLCSTEQPCVSTYVFLYTQRFESLARLHAVMHNLIILIVSIGSGTTCKISFLGIIDSLRLFQFEFFHRSQTKESDPWRGSFLEHSVRSVAESDTEVGVRDYEDLSDRSIGLHRNRHYREGWQVQRVRSFREIVRKANVHQAKNVRWMVNCRRCIIVNLFLEYFTTFFLFLDCNKHQEIATILTFYFQ